MYLFLPVPSLTPYRSKCPCLVPTKRLSPINMQVLRVVLNDKESGYDELLQKMEMVNLEQRRVQNMLITIDRESGYDELLQKMEMVNLEQRRVQNMLFTIFKCLHGAAPSYLRSHLKERMLAYSIRGHAILELPTVKTTAYGLHSFHYLGPYEWNRLPDDVRRSEMLAGFRRGVKRYIGQGK